MAAIQHADIRNLRLLGAVPAQWSPSQLRNLASDGYPNQTVANYSACPCGQERGHHCRGLGTDSCRFIRLGNGIYCLPEECPSTCPIHGEVSTISANPYVLKFGLGVPTNEVAVQNGTIQTTTSVTQPASERDDKAKDDQPGNMSLTWKRFYRFTEAVKYSNADPTIYMQCSKIGTILRIGKAGMGLGNRYNAGYQSTIDAAMWESGNAIYITKPDAHLVDSLELILISTIRPVLNTQGLNSSISSRATVSHQNMKIEDGRVVWYSEDNLT